MLLKIALLVWFVAFAVSLFAKAEGRVWMMRLFAGGFGLLLLWALIQVMRRVV